MTESPEPPEPEEPENGEGGGSEGGGEQPQSAEILIQPEQLAGLWANHAQVSYSEHEFTIDFVRLDPTVPRGIVVARLSGSATFIMQLIDTLNDVWHDWAKKAMPPEVHGDESSEADDQEPDN